MNRRDFMQKSSALGIGTIFARSETASAEPPPETHKIRLLATPAICVAPEFVAEAFLRAEGFSEVEYVKFDVTVDSSKTLARGAVDIMSIPPGNVLTALERGDPLVTLMGEHLGCYELFGHERVVTIRDLRGKRIAIDGLGGPQHVFLSAMAAYVGLDPGQDIEWVVRPSAEALGLFVDHKVDAFLGFPPEPQELRSKKIGHVIVNTSLDHPWSQYYCCMVTGHKDFVQRYPIATKRAIRAIVMAVEFCVEKPERAARLMVNKGFAKDYDFALETLRDVSYRAWRSHDPDDTLRFHALRLREVGMIKSSPQKLIENGTDWRFLNELKKELKA